MGNKLFKSYYEAMWEKTGDTNYYLAAYGKKFDKLAKYFVEGGE